MKCPTGPIFTNPEMLSIYKEKTKNNIDKK